MTNLSAIVPPIPLGPLDGRYRPAIAPLVDCLSEPALNRERIVIEVEWFIELADGQVIPGVAALSDAERAYLRRIPEEFGAAEIEELAAIERETVHDVKAVEYFLARRLAAAPALLGATQLDRMTTLLHFACTSEDINNLAYARLIQRAVREVWSPAAEKLISALATLAEATAETAMMARTHGQPATPTTMGKELAVFIARLRRQLTRIENCDYLGKINGATGTYAAHLAAVPGADWQALARRFVERLGLVFNPLTTQIESHDWQAELYGAIAHANRIVHNLATDMWGYISLGYFAQVRGQGTVGSSTMPHKVNPIRFENAEANCEISCALLDSLAASLVTSRWQRDLTDSSAQRNIGVAIGHSLLALDNVTRGLGGLDPVPAQMAADLEQNWEVLGEAIQSAMRAAALAGVAGMDNPYERLKDLTRGRRISGRDVREFVASLGLPAEAEARLAALSPADYTGVAADLARAELADVERG